MAAMERFRVNEQIDNLLSKENQRSVDVLNSLQSCAWFKMSENGVVLYYRNRGGELVPSTIIPVDDFLKAADYYCENRDSELKVAMAMTKPHGVVNIYSPYVRKSGKRRVVTNLRNDFVPLLLEFAYQVMRSTQEKGK